ncbi:MAG: superfamily II RNA helicase, partial [Mariniblastus sp.]
MRQSFVDLTYIELITGWRDLITPEPRSCNITSDELQNQRDEIAELYFDQLPFDPYPVQEEALLSWFTSEQGVLVCAPTGTGKTLIAEAAIYEALKLGKTAYYTTPLIALTDQKFRDIQESVVKWGYSADDVGLVTGNRKVNPDAKILVVVAEILLNRLLHEEAFDFDNVWAVVMDEFHSFNDRERGIVWEFGLGLLPAHIKTLLLSATVGNSMDFAAWLNRTHQRNLKLVQSDDRMVPLSYHWVEDKILPDQIESMVQGDEESRYTPALLFCFNREQCWNVAETLKGKKCVDKEQQKKLAARLEEYDWSQGVGPKMKQILVRGVGVHHAGVLPRYRQIVEELFQEKLLSVCVCTETLAAGINLPARSVVLPTLIKGPRGKMKLIEPSSIKQMFGRAGRPQFDDRGYVFALPHEDDVKILKWKEKYDQIPEDTKDPGLRKAKKALKKKQPKRREGQQYWSEAQFQQLIHSPSADLASRGPLPWRLLVYMLDASPNVELIRKLIGGR